MTARAPKQPKIGRLRLPNLFPFSRTSKPLQPATPRLRATIDATTFSIKNPNADAIRLSPNLRQTFSLPRKWRPITLKPSLTAHIEDKWIAGIESFVGRVARWLSPFSSSRIGALSLVLGVGIPGTFVPASQTPFTQEDRESLAASIPGKQTKQLRMNLFDEIMRTPEITDHFDLGTIMIVVREHGIIDPYQILNILSGRRSPGLLDRIKKEQLGQLIRRHTNFLGDLEQLHHSYPDWIDPFSPEELTQMFLGGVLNAFATPEFYIQYKWDRRFGSARPMRILMAARDNDRETILRHLNHYGITEKAAEMVADKLLSFRSNERIKPLTFMIPAFLELKNDDIPAAIAAIDGFDLEVASRLLVQYSFIINEARDAGLEIPLEDIKVLWESNVRSTINTTRHTTLGAVDGRMALSSTMIRSQVKPDNGWERIGIGLMYRREIAPRFFLHLIQGGIADVESAAGFNIELIYDGVMPVATLGLIESDREIAVVKYQGGRFPSGIERERVFTEFGLFSGGVAPLPWLAYTVGCSLAQRAKTTGKQFLWIKGENLLYGYPHVGVEYPVHLETIEDARRYNQISEGVVISSGVEIAALESKRRDLAKQLEEEEKAIQIRGLIEAIRQMDYQIKRLRHQQEVYSKNSHHVAELYDRTAQNLGFRRWGKRPWHRYTKAIEKFGSTIVSNVDDPPLFNDSASLMDDAFRFLIPDSD